MNNYYQELWGSFAGSINVHEQKHRGFYSDTLFFRDKVSRLRKWTR